MANTATSDDSVLRKPAPKGKKAQAKIGKVMGEFTSGTLKSSSGQKVSDRKQATAIALSEARRAGKK